MEGESIRSDDLRDDTVDFLFKIVLIGDASVGKTCIVQRFKSNTFVERQGSTIGVDFTMKSLEIEGKKVKVRISSDTMTSCLIGKTADRFHMT
jgi:GTPase SAR1 family protein